MKRWKSYLATVVATVPLLAGVLSTSIVLPMSAQAFNGAPDYQVDTQDYYYVLTGSKFVNGQTRDGTSGVMQFITDDPAWGYAIDTWQADGWFTQNAGVALTMMNGASIIYDNNGIENATYGNFYTEGSLNDAGLYRGYSNSNNYDWIYAGFFHLSDATTFTQMIGYFDGNGLSNDGSFNPAHFNYRMNIFSSVDGSPYNTGSFLGDVLTTASRGGTFTYSYTGVDRVFTTNNIWPAGTRDPIWRLVWTPDEPVTLAAGDYFFSHDAQVVPEPASMTLLATGLIGMAGAAARRRKRSTKA